MVQNLSTAKTTSRKKKKKKKKKKTYSSSNGATAKAQTSQLCFAQRAWCATGRKLHTRLPALPKAVFRSGRSLKPTVPPSSRRPYCGWTKSIAHLFETLGSHGVLVFIGESSFQGFLGGAGFRPSTVFPLLSPLGLFLLTEPAKEVVSAWF